MLLNLLLSSLFVVNRDNQSAHRLSKQAERSGDAPGADPGAGMQPDFSYLESLSRHSLRVSGKLEGG